jgi:hypothetical protein
MYDVVMRRLVPVLLPVLLLLLPLCGQEKVEEKKDTAKKQQPNPTNLKVLKVATGGEVVQIMHTFTAGLGVQCIYCHVQGHYASDENPKKEVARQMIRMSQVINSNFPDGKMRVTCYTCHRGEAELKTAPEPRAGG